MITRRASVLSLFLLWGSVLLLVPSPGSAQILKKVLVGTPAATLSDVPYFVALEKGFYRGEGLEIETISLAGGVGGAQAAMGGSVEFSLGLGSGTRAAMVGAPLKGIMGFNQKPIFSLYGRPDLGVKSPQDLKGKKIAVTAIGSSTDYAARSIVKHFGLDPNKDVHILALGGGTNIWAGIKSGSVEAAILWPPFDVEGTKMGLVKLLYLGDIITQPASGIVTSEKLIQENPILVKSFLRATLKGLRFFLDEKNKEESVAIMMKHFKLEKDVAGPTYDFLRTIQTPTGVLPLSAIRTEVEIAKERVDTVRDVPSDELIKRMYDFRLLQEVLKEAS